MDIPVRATRSTREEFVIQRAIPYYAKDWDGENMIRITAKNYDSEINADKVHYFQCLFASKKCGFQNATFTMKSYFPASDNGDEFMKLFRDYDSQIDEVEFDQFVRHVKQQLGI